MTRELTIIKKNAYYRVKQDFGILKKGMRCYCYTQDSEDIVLFFENPLIADIREIKLSKEAAHILEKI